MHERYIEVCDQIFFYKDHRDPLVRRAVIELIPTLASYNSTEFKELFLHKSMLYLLGQLKKDRDRTTCLLFFFFLFSGVREEGTDGVFWGGRQRFMRLVMWLCMLNQIWRLTWMRS